MRPVTSWRGANRIGNGIGTTMPAFGLEAHGSSRGESSRRLVSHLKRLAIRCESEGELMTRKGWLLFIAISVFWGIPYFFIKIAIRELDPAVVVFARAAIAAAVLIPMAASRKMLRPLFRHWPIILL